MTDDAYSPLATFNFLSLHQNHVSPSSTLVYDEATTLLPVPF